jgi:hypothetical protein
MFLIDERPYEKDSMTRTKLTAWIVAGALAAAGVGIVLFKKNEAPSAATPAATTQDGSADRSANTAPAQIEQVPQRSQDAFMPPPSSATGSSLPPAPAPK